MKIKTGYGASALPLRDQLASQGVRVRPSLLKIFQADADAITRLHMRNIATDREANAMRERVHLAIVRACVPVKAKGKR